jgi:hypothetical protein
VSKPAHSHARMSLQSVWDVRRYLSRSPVAGVACEAPGTCKQCTPQITAICDGARGTTILYLNTHAACALAPASYLEHTPLHYRSQTSLVSLPPAPKAFLCNKSDHSATKQHECGSPSNVTARGRSTSWAQHYRKASQQRRQCRACTNRNYSLPSRSARNGA